MAFTDMTNYNKMYSEYEGTHPGSEMSPYRREASPYGREASPYDREASPYGREASPYGREAVPPGYTSSGMPGSPHGGTNTTVIVQQPMTVGPPPMMPQNVREWQSGLCSCFDDCGTCLCGWLCPCCLWLKIAGRLNETPCVLCCVPGSAINLRTKMRTLYGIKGTMCRDCCEVQFCGACAVCQMERELQAMGMA